MQYTNKEDYPLSKRNNYVRFLIKLLHKKYGVKQSFIALQLGLNSNYIRDFASNRIQLKDDYLDNIENFLNDLYEGVFLFEIPQEKEEFKDFVMTLSNSPVYLNYFPRKRW